MATNKKTETQTQSQTTSHRSSSSTTVNQVMNILAFVAVCIGGVALFLAMVLKLFRLTASWIGTMKALANAIGWLALCILSFRYISHRRKIWIWVVWTVAVVMIFIGIIVPIFS